MLYRYGCYFCYWATKPYQQAQLNTILTEDQCYSIAQVFFNSTNNKSTSRQGRLSRIDAAVLFTIKQYMIPLSIMILP